jgi:hypothetical protein
MSKTVRDYENMREREYPLDTTTKQPTQLHSDGIGGTCPGCEDCTAAVPVSPVTAQPSECPTCGSRNPYDYKYNCLKNADGWHRANWKSAAPVTAQCTCPDGGTDINCVWEGHKRAAPVTGPDVAQQIARKIVSDSSEGWGPEEEEWANDIAALIRTALEEQTRDATIRLLALQKEKGEEWAKTRKQAMQLESERAEKAESETRQLRELLQKFVDISNWNHVLESEEEMNALLARAERVLGGGKPE